jgi:hypothetical protein
MEASFVWNEKAQKWHMRKGQYFLYDFFDCENVVRFFGLVDRTKIYSGIASWKETGSQPVNKEKQNETVQL